MATKNVACAVCEIHAESVFKIDGMDCRDEVAILERRLKPLPGLEDLVPDLVGQRLRVRYDAAKLSTAAIVDAVAQTGMRAWLEHEQPVGYSPAATARQTLVMASGAALAAGLFFEFADFPTAVVRATYLISILTGGIYTARRAWAATRVFALDINVLMLVAVAGAMILGEWSEGATVTFLFAFAQILEARSMDRARNAIRALMDLTPPEAIVRRNGHESRLQVDDVRIGDVLLVKPGDKIPLDGIVVAGSSPVNQAPITGESLPVEKVKGDVVYAGTINGYGGLDVRVTHLRPDTTLARIIALVEMAQSQRAPSQAFVERFAKYYTPAVIGVAIAIALDTAARDGTALRILGLPSPRAAGHLVSLRAGDFDARVSGVGHCGRRAERCVDQGRRASRACRRRPLCGLRQDRNAHARCAPRGRGGAAQRDEHRRDSGNRRRP